MKRIKLPIVISIGIPVFNEERNIKELLQQILKQKGANFVLEEVILVDDASTDKTKKIVKEINDKRIILIENKNRLGQSLSQNKIVKKMKGQYLFLINGDIRITSNNLFNKIAISILKNSTSDLFSIRPIPVASQNVFGKIINQSAYFKYSIYDQINTGNNLFNCNGRFRIMTKNFAKSIRWPDEVGEDAYSYLWCMSHGKKFSFFNNIFIYYLSPQKFSDHISQSVRHFATRPILNNYFDTRTVDAEYHIPISTFLKSFIFYFFTKPIFIIQYSLIVLYSKFFVSKKKYSQSKWSISHSSKNFSKYI